MPTVSKLALTHASLVILALLAARPAFADDLTGAPHDDPQELVPPSIAAVQTPASHPSGSLFQPMPDWSRDASMPAMPDVLRPSGHKVVVLTKPPVAAQQPLAPPSDPKEIVQTAVASKPATPAPTPDLVAVSPFLQWIKANPQGAALTAKQQAAAYESGASPDVAPGTLLPAPTGAPAPAIATDPNAATTPPPAPNPSTAATHPTEEPYWLPPLIDTPDFGARAVPSSAAIYSTPQR